MKQLKGFVLQEPEPDDVIRGISHSCGLPAHVAERQANAASQLLRADGYHSAIKTEIVEKSTWTTGCGITLWCGYKSGSALGERGKRAEVVGEEAARNLITELQSNATVDVHLADQLVPYTALADGPSELRVRTMTKHLETNVYITLQFLDVAFEIEEEITKEGAVFVIRKL